MERNDVAVVIPVFNRAYTVRESLDSVIRQSVLPTRVVVVDDGSTDDTAASVEDWIKNRCCGDLVRFVRQHHRGAAVARNTGFAMVSEAHYVAYLDSDDIWPSDFIERTTKTLDPHKSAVATTCDRGYISTRSDQVTVNDMSALAAAPTAWLFAHGAGVLSCSLLRSEFVQSLGGFRADLVTGQDSELLLRLSILGNWLHSPGKYVICRQGVAAQRGEEDHLCKSFPDYFVRWANIHEDFVQLGGGRDALSESFYRQKLARRWSQAAKQMLAAGQVAKARDCLKRSIMWRYSMKTLVRLGFAYMRRAG